MAESVHDVLAASGYPVLELPAGLSTTDGINWLMPHIEPVLAAA